MTLRSYVKNARESWFYYRCITTECDYSQSAWDDGRPKGGPKTREVSRSRRLAHEAVDPLWKISEAQRVGLGLEGDLNTVQRRMRFEVYVTIGRALGRKPHEIHMGRMGPAECERVVAAVKGETLAAVAGRVRARASTRR